MYWGTTIAVVLLCAILVSVKIREWHYGNLVYLVLPILYSANGAYGTGFGTYYHLRSVLIEATVIAVRLYILELITISIVKLIRNTTDSP